MMLDEFIEKLEKYGDQSNTYVEFLPERENPLEGGDVIKILGIMDVADGTKTLFLTSEY